MTVHHIIFDGWSVGTFVDEMCANYTAYTQGEGSPLPELSLQYRDYATWQKQTFNDNLSNPQLLYWLRQLKDCPASKFLPTIVDLQFRVLTAL